MKRQRAQDLRAAVDSLPLGTRQAMLRGLERNHIIVGADGNVRGGRCPMLAASVGSSKVTGKPFARAWDAYAGVKISRPASDHELQTLRTMLHASVDAQTQEPVDLAAAISTFSVASDSTAAGAAPTVAAPSVGRATEMAPPAAVPSVATDRGRASPVATPALAGASSAADAPPVDLRAAIDAHMASKERSRLALERAKVRPSKPRATEPASTGERDRTPELERRHGWAWLRPFRRLDEFERAVQQLEEAERAGLKAYRREQTEPPSRPRDRDRQPVGTPSGGW